MSYHDPVLLTECLEGLSIDPTGSYVDVTFGGGGHSKAILDQFENAYKTHGILIKITFWSTQFLPKAMTFPCPRDGFADGLVGRCVGIGRKIGRAICRNWSKKLVETLVEIGRKINRKNCRQVCDQYKIWHGWSRPAFLQDRRGTGRPGPYKKTHRFPASTQASVSASAPRLATTSLASSVSTQ